MRRLVVLVVVLGVLGVLSVLVPARPAVAHGGKITLEVAGDGATGVTVRAAYQSDGHPVEDKFLSLVLTATGEGGRTVGPLTLNPAPEGRGFYSTGGVLTPGRWAVVVSAADTNVIRAESTVDARAAQTAAPASSAPPAPRAGATAGAADRTGPEAAGGSGGGTWWTLAFVAALAVTGLLVIRNRRRR
jgi:hypothetical protein